MNKNQIQRPVITPRKPFTQKEKVIVLLIALMVIMIIATAFFSLGVTISSHSREDSDKKLVSGIFDEIALKLGDASEVYIDNVAGRPRLEHSITVSNRTLCFDGVEYEELLKSNRKISLSAIAEEYVLKVTVTVFDEELSVTYSAARDIRVNTLKLFDRTIDGALNSLVYEPVISYQSKIN